MSAPVVATPDPAAPGADTEHFQNPVPDLTDTFDLHFAVDDREPPVVAVADPVPIATFALARIAAVPDPDAFPGRGTFRLGHSDPAVTRLGELLIRRGAKRFYQVGPGPTFGVADRSACAAFQRAQAWTGPNADGFPGPRTWELLISGKGHDIPAGGGALRSPVPGFVATYAFGIRDRRYAAGFHTGRDYAAPEGSPIVAVMAGRVVRNDWGDAYGNWTLIDGTDGHVWLYAHQSRRAVKHGQRVDAGEVIGYVGSTGNVTGPHLHLEKSRRSSWSYAQVVNPTW